MGNVLFKIPDFSNPITKQAAFSIIKVDARDLAIHYGTKLLFKSLTKYYDTDDPIGKSLLGTPVFSNLIFGVIKYPNNVDKLYGGDTEKNKYIDIKGVTRTFTPLRIDTVLMTVSRSKNIVKTPLQGYEGTVKEYVGSDDYKISVHGVINTGGHAYPEAAVRELIKICNVPDQLPVTSNFLERFGIRYVVIDDFEFEEQRGQRSEQAFSITMFSDEAPEFQAADEPDVDMTLKQSIVKV